MKHHVWQGLQSLATVSLGASKVQGKRYSVQRLPGMY